MSVIYVSIIWRFVILIPTVICYWSFSLLQVSQLLSPWGVLLGWGKLPSSDEWYIASTYISVAYTAFQLA